MVAFLLFFTPNTRQFEAVFFKEKGNICLKSICFKTKTKKDNQEQKLIMNKARTDESAVELPAKSIDEALESRNGRQINQLGSTGFFELFRFADGFDKLLMVLGSLGAAAVGAAIPAFSLLWGNMTDAFGDSIYNPARMVQQAKEVMFNFLEIGAGIFFAYWIMFACWMVAGERQAIRCRKLYLATLLKQEIGWFDRVNQSQLASRFASETLAFQGALGEKIATFIMTIATFVSGFVIAYVKGWKLALVVTASLPTMAISVIIYTSTVHHKNKKLQGFYANARDHAKQTIIAVKTVKSLSGEEHEGNKFTQFSSATVKQTCNQSVCVGVGLGFVLFVLFGLYALSFWYCSWLILDYEPNNRGLTYTAGDIITVFYTILTVGFCISQISPSLKKISVGQQAAAKIFNILDQQNNIFGRTIEQLKGELELKNVVFAEPNNPKKLALNKVNLKFEPKKINALVGDLDKSKSALIKLIMRYQDVQSGQITLDGSNIQTLNRKWFEEIIGYVGAKPFILDTTIRQNLLLSKPNATEEQMLEALKQVYDAGVNLSEKLDTDLGDESEQLTDIEKYRITLARVILKNPTILIFDQIPPAFLSDTERILQRSAEKRTLIIVPLNIAAVKKNYRTLIMNQGSVKECRSEQFQSFKKDYQIVKNEDIIVQSKEVEKKCWSFLELFNSEDQINPNICLFIGGLVMATISGIIFPIFSIFLARMVEVLTFQQISYLSTQTQSSFLQAMMFLIVGTGAFLAITSQTSIFGVAADRLTHQLRVKCYKKILKMPVKWLEDPKNRLCNLSEILQTDCQTVSRLTCNLIGTIMQDIGCLISSIIIAFVYEWRTALVAVGLITLLLCASLLKRRERIKYTEQESGVFKKSTGITHLNYLLQFGQQNGLAKKANSIGVLLGLQNLAIFACFGITFYIGAHFVRDIPVKFVDVFTAIYALTFATLFISTGVPDLAQIEKLAARPLSILGEQDEDQLQEDSPNKIRNTTMEGLIEFKGVTFKYPGSNTCALKDFSLTIKANEKVALVGPSGSGKSTVMQLLLRFYEPDSGQILLDGKNIRDYELYFLRSRLGTVSQEPQLFSTTFRENIRYNNKDATEEAIRQVTQRANALNFIEGIEEQEDIKQSKVVEQLKTGFDRVLDDQGSHLSDSQKYRIAVARSLLRRPLVLMLDQPPDNLLNTIIKDINTTANKTAIIIATKHLEATNIHYNTVYELKKGTAAEKPNKRQQSLKQPKSQAKK